ncbi:squalene/phytoene synthase family protein [Phenylobacterium sp.]|uniref:squalene/phytoene synthase family protein n=1 Tax=Phenylobacterium sp. TaxID=1871053 RepID=UPI0027315B53|nr:squalene/phytoene synthase family protein [Phenylobacterium sp.]MDP2212357.1 squalene/phytoene synthase family protein [Phenylobacterium sp.]
MDEDASPPADDLDALVARVDPDRWLSSRLIAEPQARADVIALYAYDHELARAPRVASNALLGEIRLAWWREVLDEAYGAGPVRRHPTAVALAGVIARRGLPKGLLETMIDARYRQLDPEPLDGAEALLLARETAGTAARLAALILAGGEEGDRAEAAGALWALGRRRLSGEPPLPAAMTAPLRSQAKGLGVAAFPAGAHGVLARAYGRGQEPSPMGKRWRITLAALTGRI